MGVQDRAAGELADQPADEAAARQSPHRAAVINRVDRRIGGDSGEAADLEAAAKGAADDPQIARGGVGQRAEQADLGVAVPEASIVRLEIV